MHFHTAARRKGRIQILCVFCVALLCGAGFGCSSSPIGAAGSPGTIAYSDRGAKADVKGNVQNVNERAEQVFQKMGIQLTGTEMKSSGDERQITGKAGGKDVTVTMDADGDNVTRVEAVAQSGTQTWDKEYAKQLVSQLLAIG